MSKFKEMKFWIGDDPELSEKVQKILFEFGYGWAGIKKQEVGGTDAQCFYADRYGCMFYDSSVGNMATFLLYWSGKEEINIDWMRSAKPETVELNGKTYIKTELEEALSHIKPLE